MDERGPTSVAVVAVGPELGALCFPERRRHDGYRLDTALSSTPRFDKLNPGEVLC